MKRIKQLGLGWQPRDLWVGVYWEIKDKCVLRNSPMLGQTYDMVPQLHIYICILPMLPIFIVIQ